MKLKLICLVALIIWQVLHDHMGLAAIALGIINEEHFPSSQNVLLEHQITSRIRTQKPSKAEKKKKLHFLCYNG